MSDRLTFKQDHETGNWEAILDHHYHAIGMSKDQAVKRLYSFLKAHYPETFYGSQDEFEAFFAPKRTARNKNVGT